MRRRNRRSPSGRSTWRSICGRAASISLSYCTPDGQAVTQAMHPRQVSKCRAYSGVMAAFPSTATFIRWMRPRGESVSRLQSA